MGERKPFPGLLQGCGVLAVLFVYAQIVGVVLAITALIWLVAWEGPGPILGDPQALSARLMHPWFIAVGNTFSFAVILVPAWLLTRAPAREVFAIRRFSPWVLMPLFLVAPGLSVVLSEFDNLLRVMLPAPEWLTALMQEIVQGGGWSLVCLSVVAPITEEFLFRGLLFRGFEKRDGGAKAVLLTARCALLPLPREPLLAAPSLRRRSPARMDRALDAVLVALPLPACALQQPARHSRADPPLHPRLHRAGLLSALVVRPGGRVRPRPGTRAARLHSPPVAGLGPSPIHCPPQDKPWP